jgi:hypothetical protein
MSMVKTLQIGLIAMEALACSAGLLNWRKFKNSYAKWFVIYLALIAVSELIGISLTYIFQEYSLNKSLYNYFVIPLEFLFFCWLYYQHFKNSNQKYWPMTGAILYFTSWLINIILLPTLRFWSVPFSYLIGVIVLLVLVIAFFSAFMSSNEILGYRSDLLFWISLGLLIFYVVSSPFYGLRLALYKEHPNLFWLYYYIQFGANYLMYLFFSIALIWGKPR